MTEEFVGCFLQTFGSTLIDAGFAVEAVDSVCETLRREYEDGIPLECTLNRWMNRLLLLKTGENTPESEENDANYP